MREEIIIEVHNIANIHPMKRIRRQHYTMPKHSYTTSPKALYKRLKWEMKIPMAGNN
jgi:hypothetical protein